MRVQRGLIAIALLCAAASPACGGGGDGGTAIGCPMGLVDKATSPVTIDFWFSEQAANQDTVFRMVDRFNASQRRVHVNAAYQGSYDESASKYLAALRGGDLPDIAQVVDFETQRMIDSGSVAKAQECIDAEGYDLSDYLPRVIAYWSVGGELWSYPYTAAADVLYYNELAFEKAGLDPQVPPVTLDDVRAYSQRLVDAGVTGHGISLEMHSWSIENWLAKSDQIIVNNGNGRNARATEAAFDTDATRDLFTWIDEMIDDGLALNVGRNASGADTLLPIGSGDVAMTHGSSAAMRSVFGVLESGEFPNVKVGVAPMAGGPGGVVVGGASLFIVNRSSAIEQEAARIFARWLNEPEQQAEWHIGSGYIPLRTSTSELPAIREFWAANPQFRVAFDELSGSDVTEANAGAVVGPFIEVRRAIVEAMESMVLQGTSPEDAVRNAARAATDAIESYNERVD